MRAPKPHNLAELCQHHTQNEIGEIVGVTGPTIGNWCRAEGLQPAYRCFQCKQAKPRELFKSQRRCLKCDDDIRDGVCEVPRTCNACGVTKPANQFTLFRNSNTYSGSCKACKKAPPRTFEAPLTPAAMPATGGPLRSRLVQGVV